MQIDAGFVLVRMRSRVVRLYDQPTAKTLRSWNQRLPRLCHDFLKLLDLPLILTEGLASTGLSREVRGVVSNAIALIKRERDRIQTRLIWIPTSF